MQRCKSLTRYTAVRGNSHTTAEDKNISELFPPISSLFLCEYGMSRAVYRINITGYHAFS